MAAVSIWGTLEGWARDAWNFVSGVPGDIVSAVQHLWHMAISVSQVVDWMIRHPLLGVTQALEFIAGLVTGNHAAMINALHRVQGWIWGNQVNPLRRQVLLWFAQLRARIAYLFAVAYAYINLLYRRSIAFTRAMVAAEHKAMMHQFQVAEAYTRQQDALLHAGIEKEAASAYSATLHDRAGTVQRIADLIATRNPALRAIERDVIRIVLDLLVIDDPLARLAAGFFIREIVNRLGIDRLAGQLLADLAGPLLGDPHPKGIPDVIRNIGGRIDAQEAQWATFIENGGAQVEQAGDQWRDITGLATDAALLGMFADMVARPQQWAAEVAAIAGPAVREATAAVNAALH